MNKETPFYLFLFGAILIVISPYLMTQGMFMDGMIYAAVAKNMADGLGTLWQPFFTETCYPEFYQHPPLAIGIQSLFFRIFGDSFLIEKFYSFGTWLITAWGLVKIWRFFELRNAWLPLLFLIILPRTNWALTNNTLENTLAIFVIFSIYFYLKSSKGHWMNMLFSGLFLAAAFLTKGPFGLYVWALPMIYEFLVNKRSVFFSLWASVKLIGLTVLPLVLLYSISDAAFENLKNYYTNQILNSFENEVTVESRWFIIRYFLAEIIVPTLIVLLLLFISFRKFKAIKLDSSAKRRALSFFILVIFGVLPIMISMKQSGFYILPTFPIIALVCAFLVAQSVEQGINQFMNKKLNKSIFYGISFAVLTTGLALNIKNYGAYGRDKEKMTDMHKIAWLIKEERTLSVSEELWLDWTLQAYFQRYYGISMDGNQNTSHTYYLLTSTEKPEQFGQNLSKITSKTNAYHLFKIKALASDQK